MIRFNRWIVLTVLLLALPSTARSADEPTTPGASGTPATETTPPKTVAPPENYQPPFPHRDELFQPPSAKRLSSSQRNEVSSDVGLKGFMNFDGAKVLLAIDGRVTPLGVGETVSGVEVISINPPQVTLQRGRVRWTETLYEARGNVANDIDETDPTDESAPVEQSEHLPVQPPETAQVIDDPATKTDAEVDEMDATATDADAKATAEETPAVP